MLTSCLYKADSQRTCLVIIVCAFLMSWTLHEWNFPKNPTWTFSLVYFLETVNEVIPLYRVSGVEAFISDQKQLGEQRSI